MKLLILILVGEMYLYETLACFFLYQSMQRQKSVGKKNPPNTVIWAILPGTADIVAAV